MELNAAGKIKAGTKVLYWPGWRTGDPKTGVISHDGVYECGGTAVVYIAGRGAVAITHVDIDETA